MIAKTPIVFGFFVSAILLGLLFKYMTDVMPVTEENRKETFMQKEAGMPYSVVDDVAPMQGFSGVSPLLGSDPKPVPERPYEQADDNKLFLFQNNHIGAECCPSPFSTGEGCVCLTDEQRLMFSTRGGNRSV